MDIHDSVIAKIREADRAGADALLDAWADEHGYEAMLAEVLDPVLRKIGEGWRSTEVFTLAHGYVAAKVAEDVLLKIAAHRRPDVAPPLAKGPVVIGNIEDDFHSLGRRMVATFLRTDGWIVHDLGNDVPAKDFVDKAVEVDARVIGVSAMVLTTANNIKRLREEIDRRGLAGRIQLAVGGAVFSVCHSLVEEVGSDGTAVNALEAVPLFERLWEKSVQQGNAG